MTRTTSAARRTSSTPAFPGPAQAEGRDVGVAVEQPGHGAAQASLPEPVNEPELTPLGQGRVVEQLVHAGQGLVHREPHEVDLSGREVRAPGPGDYRPDRRSTTASPLDGGEQSPGDLQPLPAGRHDDLTVPKAQHLADETQVTDADTAPGLDLLGGLRRLGTQIQAGARERLPLGASNLCPGLGTGPRGGPGGFAGCLQAEHRLANRFVGLAGGLIALLSEVASEGLELAPLLDLDLCLGPGESLPLSGQLFPLLGDPLGVRGHCCPLQLELSEQRLGLGLLLVQTGAGVGHHLRGEPEPLGHLERQAAPRGSERELVGRLVGVGVVAERGAAHSRRRLPVGLHQAVVGRGDHHRPALAEVVDDGDTEPTSLRRVGSRTHLVQKHQCRHGQVLCHLDDRGQVGREGGQVGCDRLLVSDVGVDALEDRELAARGHRDVQAALGHQREQANRLQRHRLPARVGAADDQHRRARSHSQVDRHGLVPRAPGLLLAGQQQRVPRLAQIEAQVIHDVRGRGVQVRREERLGLNGVQLPQGVGGLSQLVGHGPDPGGQLAEDPGDLPTLVLAQGHDVVVELHGWHRFHEEARA